MPDYLGVPNKIIGGDNAYNQTWTELVSPTGAQASAVISRGSQPDANYLTISVAEDTALGANGNRFTLSIVDGSPTGAAYDADTKTLTVTYTGSVTLAALRTAIAALTEFSVVLTGTSGNAESSSGGIERKFSGGLNHVVQNVAVSMQQHSHFRITTSEAAPTSTDTDILYRRAGGPYFFQLPPGYRMWAQSASNNQSDASAEIYFDSPDTTYMSD